MKTQNFQRSVVLPLFFFFFSFSFLCFSFGVCFGLVGWLVGLNKILFIQCNHKFKSMLI